LTPLTVDEALGIQERIGDLLNESQLQQAIDLLDDAVERATDPALKLEMQLELAPVLWMADEFTRAAALFDEILPKLRDRDDTAVLHYYAGVSHAEIGEIEPAIEQLTAFLACAEPSDPLYRDATYRLGLMMPLVGRVEEGLQRLRALRALLVAEYGSASVHVTTLDRRIERVGDLGPPYGRSRSPGSKPGSADR
jgi:tetratricopeptide (TPR) repeat protein